MFHNFLQYRCVIISTAWGLCLSSLTKWGLGSNQSHFEICKRARVLIRGFVSGPILCLTDFLSCAGLSFRRSYHQMSWQLSKDSSQIYAENMSGKFSNSLWVSNKPIRSHAGIAYTIRRWVDETTSWFEVIQSIMCENRSPSHMKRTFLYKTDWINVLLIITLWD